MKPQKPQLGVMGQLSSDIFDDLDFVVKNGFDWFEIALDWKQNYNLDSRINKIKKISKDNNLNLIVHTAFYLPTSTMIPEIRKAVVDYSQKSIILAKKLGADRLTIHPGYREMPGPAINLAYESLINNLRKIVDIGDKYEVNICLENLDKMFNLLCWDVKDYLNVLKSVRGIKATLDIGHAHTAGLTPDKYLMKVKDYVMDMHIHDNSGEHDEHKGIGQGNINFEKFLYTCKRIGYYGPFTFELFPYENILDSKQKFLELWEKAR